MLLAYLKGDSMIDENKASDINSLLV